MSKILNTFSLKPWEEARWADVNGNWWYFMLMKDFAHTVPHMRLKNNPEREKQLCCSTPGFRDGKGSWDQWVAKSRFVSSSSDPEAKILGRIPCDTDSYHFSQKTKTAPKLWSSQNARRRPNQETRTPRANPKNKRVLQLPNHASFQWDLCLDFVGARIGKVWKYKPLKASLPTNPSPLTL